MRISNIELRRVIRSVISETMDFDLVPKMVPKRGFGMSSMMQRAEACIGLDKDALFDMCAQICKSNSSMAMHCADLCMCVCNNDAAGCRRCLESICNCPNCDQICLSCCGC